MGDFSQLETSKPLHKPVLRRQVREALFSSPGTYFDGTFGAGGHTRDLLEASPEVRVLAVDRDPQAIANGRALQALYPRRLLLREGCFSDLAFHAQAEGIETLQGVLLDLGVSSMQLDAPERGFSFMRDGPLDMRLGSEGRMAADVVNEMTEERLERVIRFYGEERLARRIGRAIVAFRAEKPFTRTLELAQVVATAVRRAKKSRGPERIHPATRTFQALRIALNDELRALVQGLFGAEKTLCSGGRLCVISFHSLEDRIVKRFIASRCAPPAVSRYVPSQPEAFHASFKKEGKGLFFPGLEEIDENSRARSAKLRVAIRTEAPPLIDDADLEKLAALPEEKSVKTRKER